MLTAGNVVQQRPHSLEFTFCNFWKIAIHQKHTIDGAQRRQSNQRAILFFCSSIDHFPIEIDLTK